MATKIITYYLMVLKTALAWEKSLIIIKKKMKKYLVVTGGAGFIGSNLIEYLIKKTNYNILSIDNYSYRIKKKSYK